MLVLACGERCSIPCFWCDEAYVGGLARRVRWLFWRAAYTRSLYTQSRRAIICMLKLERISSGESRSVYRHVISLYNAIASAMLNFITYAFVSNR